MQGDPATTEQPDPRALIETAHDLIASVDAEGRWTYVNAAAERIYGYTPEEMLGRPFTELLDPAHAQDNLSVFGRVISGESVDGFETVHRHKDGSPVTMLFNAVPVLDAGGRVVGVTATGTDVTERSRAAAEVRAAHARMQSILDNTAVAVYIKDREGRYTFANRYVADFFGLTREEVLGRRDADLLPPDDAAVLRAADLQVLDTGELLEREETAGERTYLTVKFPLRDDRGAPVEVCGISIDVTERERARVELRRRANEQAALAELGVRAFKEPSLAEMSGWTAEMVLRLLGVDACVVYAHDHGARRLNLVGWAGRDGIPRPPESGSVADVPASIDALADASPVVITDTRSDPRIAESGRSFAIGFESTVTVPLLGAEGLQGLVSVFSQSPPAEVDLAFLQAVAAVLAMAFERARADAALEERNREIAQLAAARGRLVVEALGAEDRERARLADAIHDDALQNLLAVRQDLAEAERHPERALEVMVKAREIIELTVRGLRELISTVHPVSLGHAGIEASLSSLADSYARRAGFHVEVRVEPDAGSGHDPLVLRIARELLTNVEKHARASRVELRARRDGESVVLEVEDDGRGMAEGRAADAVRAGHIGLASATERVSALGGHFDVSSSPGAGTRVRVELPA